MAIKLGIYLGKGLPHVSAGGAFSLGDTIFQEILTFDWQDVEVFIFHYEPRQIASKNPHITYISLAFFVPHEQDWWLVKFCKKIGNRLCYFFKKKNFKLNAACIKYAIDLVWFPTPVFEAVAQPYFFTIWDLQHRKQPYFPEVSVSGSSFEEREKFYSNIVQKAARVIVGNSVGAKEVQQFYSISAERIVAIEFPVPAYCRGMDGVSPWILKQVQDDEPEYLRISRHPELVSGSTQNSQPRPLLPPHPYLFYPAQFWPHKNHVVILEAVKKLASQGIIFDVIFTGADKGNLHYIQQYTASLGLDTLVHFKGFVSQAELIIYYQQAFALVFASFFGPNNLPPLEAMALGCPVVCAEYDGAHEQLDEAALYFSPTDEQALIHSLLSLKGNTKLRDQLIRKGKILAEQRSPQQYIEHVYREICAFRKVRRLWAPGNEYRHV